MNGSNPHGRACSWNMTSGSARRSSHGTAAAAVSTAGWRCEKHQPQWAKRKPREALCGSASVSECLWCTRWWCAQWNIVPWFEIEWQSISASRSGNVASYERCAHRRCEPAVTPRPVMGHSTNAHNAVFHETSARYRTPIKAPTCTNVMYPPRKKFQPSFCSSAVIGALRSLAR